MTKFTSSCSQDHVEFKYESIRVVLQLLIYRPNLYHELSSSYQLISSRSKLVTTKIRELPIDIQEKSKLSLITLFDPCMTDLQPLDKETEAIFMFRKFKTGGGEDLGVIGGGWRLPEQFSVGGARQRVVEGWPVSREKWD